MQLGGSLMHNIYCAGEQLWWSDINYKNGFRVKL